MKPIKKILGIRWDIAILLKIAKKCHKTELIPSISIF